MATEVRVRASRSTRGAMPSRDDPAAARRPGEAFHACNQGRHVAVTYSHCRAAGLVSHGNLRRPMLTPHHNKDCAGVTGGARRALSPDVLASAEPGMGRDADVIARTSATSMVQPSDMEKTSATVWVSEANLVWRLLSVNQVTVAAGYRSAGGVGRNRRPASEFIQFEQRRHAGRCQASKRQSRQLQ